MAQAILEQQETSRVYVDILGEKFTIRGAADPGYIAEVGRVVDSRMRELRDSNTGMSRYRVAILAALNLADELLQARIDLQESRDGGDNEQVIQKTRELITLLDEGLVGDTLSTVACR